MRNKKNHMTKEIVIFVLLLILIMLIAAVALYDFIPANINIPEQIEYTSDSATTSIKQEIAYTNGGDATADQSATGDEYITSLKSYSIQASDLTVYGEKNLYNSGNSNPFDYVEEATNTTDAEATQNTTNTTTNTNTATNTTNTAQNTNTTNTTETANVANTTTTTAGTTTGTFFENASSK